MVCLTVGCTVELRFTLCFLRQCQLGQVQRVASPDKSPIQPLSPLGGTPLRLFWLYDTRRCDKPIL